MKIKVQSDHTGFFNKIILYNKKHYLKYFFYLVVISILVLIIIFISKNKDNDRLSTYSEEKLEEKKKIDEKIQSGKPIDFLTLLNHHNDATIFLSVRDDASTNLPDTVKNKLIEIGSKKISELDYRGSYLAIIENNQFIVEEVNNSEKIEYTYNKFSIKSAGMGLGDDSKISIYGLNLSPNVRGLNVVVKNTKGFYESYNFDFYGSSNPTSKLLGKTPYQPELENLEIIVKEKNFEKIKAKREEALKIGLLLSSSDDFVPAKIKYRDEIYDANIRLKGDWTDHLKSDKKWSYRIDLKGDNMLFGMSKFNIHHPLTRNYIGDWMFHRALKEENIIGLRYFFLNADLQIEGENKLPKFNLGIYALEESFDKFLIENNQRREGLILKINENLMWESMASGGGWIEINHRPYLLSMNILPFSQKTILKDPNLKNQFDVARNLFYSFIENESKISEIFDVGKLAKYNAISCLLGSFHGLALHNARLYYNPVNSRFEPIGFDGVSGASLTRLHFYTNAENDIDYLKHFVEALEEVSQKKYLDSLFIKMDDLDKNVEVLKREFPNAAFDREILYNNQKVIRHEIDPPNAFHAFLLGISNGELKLQLRSIFQLPIEILSLSYQDKKMITKPNELYLLRPRETQTLDLALPEYYQNLFVSKRKKKTVFSRADDIKDLVINYRVYGSNTIRTEHILPWKEKEDNFQKIDLPTLQKSNVSDFDFLYIDENEKTITFQSGKRKLDKNLIIPRGYTVLANQGLELDLTNQAKIISYSPLVFTGTEDTPIRITSSDRTGHGILVMDAKRKSEISYVRFSKLSNPRQGKWNVTGAVNFYESPVNLKNVMFTENNSEDALNIIRTSFEMDRVVFRETRSDAFDGDFVKGIIKNTYFENLGNDAVDISGSNVTAQNISIFNAGDKGLSAGESSTLTAKNVKINDSEIAVASKDLSTIQLDSIIIENCKLGYTAFQKKSEFGPAKITAINAFNKSCPTPFLIEDLSSLYFNSKAVETSKGVIDKMYGKEYGKSSK